MNYPISHYLSVTTAYSPQFTADSASLLFLQTITGIPQVWEVAYRPGNDELLWPEQISFAADRVLGVWKAPAGTHTIFSHDIGGDENAQLFLLDNGVVTNLCEGHEGAMHTFGAWSPDGQSFVFASNRRHPGRFDLYHQTLDGSPARLIWEHEQSGYLAYPAISPDGERVAVIRASASFAHELFEIEIGTGRRRELTPAGDKARFQRIAYSQNGQLLYLLTDFKSDFVNVLQLDLQTGALESVVSLEHDIYTLAVSPDFRYMAYSVNIDGGSDLHLLALETGKTTVAPRQSDVPGVIAMYDQMLCFSPDSTRLAFSFSCATATSDIYVWELDSGRVQQATRSTHGGIPQDSFVPPELIRYPTFDGLAVPAWFYRPQNPAGKLPVVVIVHGGPESQFRAYFHFLAQYLVHNGYAVLAPNVRGSTGYGKTYSQLDDVEKRMDSVADLAYAAHWLKAHPDIDGKRIIVYGGSYGGFMVLSALTTYPNLWAGGVNIVGISSFVTFLENTSDYRRAHRESEYGSLARDREFLDSISPINHIDNISVPLMVIHGANDPRVPVSEAEQLVHALEKRDVPVELLIFDDEGHGVAKHKNKLVMYPAVAKFLAKHTG